MHLQEALQKYPKAVDIIEGPLMTAMNQVGDLFGKEKDKGALKGILDQIAQYVFGEEVYPSIEEKAAKPANKQRTAVNRARTTRTKKAE